MDHETSCGTILTAFTGPAGSQTPIHSDVLHSFSWSYNIVGHKRWTFYSPLDDGKSIVVEQHSGDCIFVPSGWKHKVLNVVETLSINHNWVTSANVDLMLTCIMAELKAVEVECREWNVEGQDALESMLRGCVGVDITACFLLLLSSLLDCILVDAVELAFNLSRIVSALRHLGVNDKLDLVQRLAAVLKSKEKALQAFGMATELILVIDQVTATA